MKFDVTFRAKDGKQDCITIEAESRAAVFPILKEKGITAISVSEADGKARPKKRGTSPKAPSPLKGVAAGILVVVIALIAWYFLAPKPAAPEEPVETPKVVKDVEPLAPRVLPKAEEPAPQKPAIDPEIAARRAMLKAMSPQERLDYLFEEAKKRPIDLSPSTNRAFRTGTEQVMSWIFTTKVGDAPPPLPRLPMFDEAHMAEIILAPNPVLDTDSERVKDAKEMVQLAKKELITFIKNGGDVEEFLEYYHGQLVQAHREWQESQKSVLQVIREEPEIAAEYVEEVNSRLAEKGIKPVVVPPKLRERLGLE